MTRFSEEAGAARPVAFGRRRGRSVGDFAALDRERSARRSVAAAPDGRSVPARESEAVAAAPGGNPEFEAEAARLARRRIRD